MNILVIGGTSGIGEAITRQLIESGNTVTCISRNKPETPQPGVEYLQMDITSDVTIPDQEIDGVVYAPGTINLKPFNRLKREDFLNDFDINVWGAVNVLQQTHPMLKKSESASVVLFSTVAVGQGMPYHSSTAAAKGAIEGLARSLAAEWAPAIRVNVIAPSVTDTPMASRLVGSDERRNASAERHPLKKIGTPEDIASMATFLLGTNSSWITGQVIGVDGGLSSLRN